MLERCAPIFSGVPGVGSPSVEVLGTSPSLTHELNLRCNGIDNGCCNEEQPCLFGDGDCDVNEHCSAGLHCGIDNCVGSGFDATDDCCEPG